MTIGRSITLGVFAGLLTGISISGIMTLIDWVENPDKLFRNPTAGTNWPIVGETFFSWLLPLLPVTTIFAVCGALSWAYCQRCRQNTG